MSDRTDFEEAIKALQGQLANAGTHLVIDANARMAYDREIGAMSRQLRAQARSGAITWAQAAAQAREMRNVIMEILRGRSTAVGRSLAEYIKRQGKTLNELIALKTLSKFGAKAEFPTLTTAQQNVVFTEIVVAAGRSNATITGIMRVMPYAGRGLLVWSIAMSVYTVAESDNPVSAAGREAATTGAAIAGGLASGALAGLACGPGAPVCVTLGAFIGGALAAFTVGYIW